MMTTTLLLAFGLVQAAPDSSEPVEEPFHVEDPFEIDDEEAAPTETTQVAANGEAPGPSPDRLVCRSRGELGARTRRVRVCMTAAQWQLHDANMEQQRRDINDWGMHGMGR